MPALSKTTPVVVDTSKSRHAAFNPISVADVNLKDGFWNPRRTMIQQVTLKEQHRLLEETGRMDNFRRAAGDESIPFRGIYFNDSDVYKWVEAAAWALACENDAELSDMLEAVVDAIAPAQQDDGYLNTYFIYERAEERWSDLETKHELYLAGHLFQAAVAHNRVTGSTKLLDVACRFADLIDSVFGPEEDGKRSGAPGHPEIEMALVELGRQVEEKRYIELAKFFLDQRGKGLLSGRWELQDHTTVNQLKTMDGHAVRMVYLCCGMADVYAETGDEALDRSLDALWSDMAHSQMYITGGLGSRHFTESFGVSFELPNFRAYAETCAAIANVMWNHRMLLLYGDAKYADVMEQALYNGVTVGLSLSGEKYFYHNPLADPGPYRRTPWFSCACCPPNIARLLASIQGYYYSVATDGLYVHLYSDSESTITLSDGKTIKITQQTQYPWDGDIELTIEGEGKFSLFLRIPGWCDSGSIKVNGADLDGEIDSGEYVEIKRVWKSGDVVNLTLPMPVRLVETHPYALENSGRVAVMRGPLVYCLEGVDNPDVDLRDVALSSSADFSTDWQPELLGGIQLLTTTGTFRELDDGWKNSLYRTAEQDRGSGETTMKIVAIPYYAWANREESQMQVWLLAR